MIAVALARCEQAGDANGRDDQGDDARSGSAEERVDGALAPRIHRALDEVLACTADAVFVVDQHQVVRHANPAVATLRGEAVAALVGRLLPDILEAPAALWAELAAGSGGVVDMRLHRPGAPSLPVEVSIGPPGLFGRALRLVVVRDASARLAREAALARLALTDSLTGLANRLAFEDRLRQAIGRADRYGGLVAVHLLDLDGFKRVNDSHGHAVGDAALVAAAERLRPIVRATDTLARIGGDEFVLLQTDLQGPEGARIAASRLLDALTAPLEVADRALSLAASIGTALYPTDARSPDELYAAADRALYAAKRAGGRTIVLAREEEEEGPRAPEERAAEEEDG